LLSVHHAIIREMPTRRNSFLQVLAQKFPA
jgi:hypothetical protein